MAHPLVEQLRFTRGEFRRCLDGVGAEEALVRHGRMNCVSWIVGHLAWHENQTFVYLAQGIAIQPELRRICAYGCPPSTPDLASMWAAWHEVTASADHYLDTLTSADLESHLQRRGKPLPESQGTMLHRAIYHYWFHLGEAHAIRQMLGHEDLPQFVGDQSAARFRPG